MKIIRLRQPHMQIHVDDIWRVESSVGDDNRRGAWIYLRDGSERRLCDETAKRVREIIDVAKSKEEILLDALTITLLLKAANEAEDGRLQFTNNTDGLSVSIGAVRMSQLQGRVRSKYEHAEKQISAYALVIVESKGIYRLNERGYQLADFLVANNFPDKEPFSGFVKLPTRFPEAPSQVAVQINQWNNNSGDVNNAVSEKGDVEQSIK
jgi:hypothetical protein